MKYSTNTNISIDINQIFYFIDNGHITGLNVPFKLNSCCYVTTNKNTISRDLLQGIYRLRDIELLQKIIIIKDESYDIDKYVENEINNYKQ